MTNADRSPTPWVRHALWVLPALVLWGCGASDGGAPTGPEPADPPSLLGDPRAGEVAFVESCAECHASRDGFDLAHFDFSPFDVIRRAVAHVDSATARDIAAHIEALDAARLRRTVSPFQPGGKIRGAQPYFVTSNANDDRDFWTEALGTPGWPAGLTAEALRAIDPRDIPVPLSMPRWSLEGSDEDWMPDVPVPAEIMDYAGGAVRTALAAYYANPTEANLLAVLTPFGEATKGPDLPCWREDPVPCFDARRWMASLGAQHYLRSGAGGRVPTEVARVWWDVGESEIALQVLTTTPEDRDAAFRSGARWMYVAFAQDPEAFREPAGYMGTFLRSQGLDRVSLFAALRRMVGDGPAHRQHPDQFLEDGRLALQRLDAGVALGVAEFVFQHFADRLEAGRPASLDLTLARSLVTETWDSARRWSYLNQAQWARIQNLHARVVQLLQ